MVRSYRKLEGISPSSGTRCYCRQNEHVEYVERGETDGEARRSKKVELSNGDDGTKNNDDDEMVLVVPRSFPNAPRGRFCRIILCVLPFQIMTRQERI